MTTGTQASAGLVGDSIRTLVKESLLGGVAGNSWFLNGGDPGIVPFLQDISAAEASTRPGEGRKTIAAHATHVLFHLELIDRMLKGQPEAFASADWSIAWQNEKVDEQQWRELTARLATLAEQWIDACANVRVTDTMALTGTMGSAAHFAYHLGAMRQILLDVRHKSPAS